MKNITIKSSTGVEFSLTKEGWTNYSGVTYFKCLSKKGDELYLRHTSQSFKFVHDIPSTIENVFFSKKVILDIIYEIILNDFYIEDIN